MVPNLCVGGFFSIQGELSRIFRQIIVVFLLIFPKIMTCIVLGTAWQSNTSGAVQCTIQGHNYWLYDLF